MAAAGNALASPAMVALCGGRSITGPRQLLLPSGCSLVIISIIGIIKTFFFQLSVSWPPLESESSSSLLLSALGEDTGEAGEVGFQNLIWKGSIHPGRAHRLRGFCAPSVPGSRS